MDPTIITFAIAGIAAGPLLARLAARRSPAQPIDVDVDAERRLIASTLADPQLTVVANDATGLVAEHFSSASRQALWQRCIDAADAGSEVDVEGLEGTVETVDDVGPYDDYDAANVVDAAEARVIYQGGGCVEADPTTGELHRVYERPSVKRQIVAAAICAVGFWFSAWAAGQVAAGWAQVAGLFALAATVATGYMLSAIDHDTLTLDYMTLFVGGAAAWLFAAWQAVELLEPERLLQGVIAGALWFLVFTGLNLTYRLLRGVDGIGGGDWKIAAVCAAVPAAIAGTFLVGFFAVTAGMFVALAVQIPRLISGKAERMTRFAMGPYIAVGWPLAWLFVDAQGLLP